MLLNAFDAKLPEPYIGFGLTYGPATELRAMNKSLLLGFPFQVGKLEFEEYRDMRLLVLPEMIQNSDLFAFTLGMGPEIIIPFGYKQTPMGLFVGVQGGIFLGIVTDTKLTAGDDSSPSRGSFTYGGAIDFNLGPHFDISEKAWFRFRLHTKLALGDFVNQRFRMKMSRYLSWWLGFGVQAAFF